MKRLAILILPLLLACQPAPRVLEDQNLLVLEGATILTGNLIVESGVIAIAGDRIVGVGRTGDFSYPDDASIRDARDLWIVPGYIDTHVHLTEQQEMDRVLRLMVADGITTMRTAAGLAEANVALRQQINSGERIGPYMQTAGLPIDTPDGPFSWMSQVSTPEEMRAEIRRQAALGVDYIKIYRTIGPDLAAVAVDESHTLGLRVIGHLNMTTWAEASAMGFDGILHSGIFAPTWELAPRDTWDAIRKAFNEGKTAGDEAGFQLLLEHVDVESEGVDDWVNELVSRGTPLEPNLVMLKSLLWGDDEEVFRSFEPEASPESWQDTFRLAFPHVATVSRTEAWLAAARKTYPLFEQLALSLYRAGATLSVGTDMMNPWMTPGTSYHRELQLLSSAGLTNGEVLIAATRHGAAALKLENDVGAIEEGKIADLVVLKSNPLHDTRNFRDIHAVFLRGQEIDPGELLAE